MIDYWWAYIILTVFCGIMFWSFTKLFNPPDPPKHLLNLVGFMRQKFGVKWERTHKHWFPYNNSYSYEWHGKLNNIPIKLNYKPGNTYHNLYFGDDFNKRVIVEFCICEVCTADIQLKSFVSPNHNRVEFFNLLYQNCEVTPDEKLYLLKTILEHL